MRMLECYDRYAERIREIADMNNATEADVIEAMFDFIDHEANLLDEWSGDLISEYIV